MISVIVTIYNLERYLRCCIDSIIAQTYEDLEIILVDDESVDASPQICDEYAGWDARIRVLYKQNGVQEMPEMQDWKLRRGIYRIC